MHSGNHATQGNWDMLVIRVVTQLAHATGQKLDFFSLNDIIVKAFTI